MKRVVIRKTGGPEVLEIVDVPVLLPKDDEVLIDLKATGLNWSEVMIRRGEWPVDLSRGFTLGAEGAGVVEAVGGKVAHVKLGDRVANLEVLAYMEHEQGNYAEKITVNADKILAIPDHMSFAEATSAPLALLTAYDALINHSPLPATGTTIVTACTGSVGVAALQLARRRGLRVIGTTRAESKKSLIASCGCEPVVYSDPLDLKEKILQKVGTGGVDYVFDPIGGATATQLLSLVNGNGTYVVYGSLDSSPFVSPGNFLFNQIKIHGYVVLQNLADPIKMQRVWSEILPLLETREVTIPVYKTFPFDKVVEAHRAMERHSHFGKLVLVR